QVAITLDLEMSRDYPRRGMMEWDYQKGNLDEPTRRYAVEAARIVKQGGGRIHFFCVGRVLEQPDVDWLKDLAAEGHKIGNHTYDHVNLLAKTPVDIQFRFRRAPWLIAGRTVPDVLRENIALTAEGLKQRAGIEQCGFRSPGGFAQGLQGREDLQTMLRELGFPWASTLYPRHLTGKPGERPGEEVYADIVRAVAAAQPFVYPSGLVEVPMSPISDVNAFRSNFWPRESFLEAIRRAVGWAVEQGGVFDFLAHPSCLVVEDPELESIRLICDLVRQAGNAAELATLDQIADRALSPFAPRK
ncbi:MAG: polysaccharide deacetylase family protein, partial [Pirellulaceae bacterium]|nr:polysaccharide deacetylase family protein [Pirellulaceae bacterium]